jgi:hypothetical protein
MSGTAVGATLATVPHHLHSEVLMAIEQSIADRFWPKVDWAPNATGCARWTAGLDGNGYGRFWLDGRTQSAHRVAWMLEHGPIPDDRQVLHRCNQPICVNVEHLSLGTHGENMDYRNSLGRQARPRGERNGQAKLTEAQVLEIRREYVSGSRTHGTVALGRRYGVNRVNIWRILAGQTWAAL